MQGSGASARVGQVEYLPRGVRVGGIIPEGSIAGILMWRGDAAGSRCLACGGGWT